MAPLAPARATTSCTRTGPTFGPPFHYITNERVIQVDLVSNSATLEETSVELGRITSVRLFDPIFGSFIGIQRVEVFLAEGQKPKIVIPFQHRAVQIRALLDPRR